MKKEGKSSLEGKTKGDGDQERVEENKQRRKGKKKRIRKALMPIVRAGESEPFSDLISD